MPKTSKYWKVSDNRTIKLKGKTLKKILAKTWDEGFKHGTEE